MVRVWVRNEGGWVDREVCMVMRVLGLSEAKWGKGCRRQVEEGWPFGEGGGFGVGRGKGREKERGARVFYLGFGLIGL